MNSPLPQIKLELRSVSKSLFTDSRLLAKVSPLARKSWQGRVERREGECGVEGGSDGVRYRR